uniref:Uncharacterized protein n=1 Tax=Ditylenchus dipsaci TaxID=166011 RepID=A0A915DXP6_9BILA
MHPGHSHCHLLVQKVKGQCYKEKVVQVGNSTLFITPGSRELQTQATVVNCTIQSEPLNGTADIHWSLVPKTSAPLGQQRLAQFRRQNPFILDAPAFLDSESTLLKARFDMLTEYSHRINLGISVVDAAAEAAKLAEESVGAITAFWKFLRDYGIYLGVAVLVIVLLIAITAFCFVAGPYVLPLLQATSTYQKFQRNGEAPRIAVIVASGREDWPFQNTSLTHEHHQHLKSLHLKSVRGQVPVRLLNLTNTPLTVYQGSHIGKLGSLPWPAEINEDHNGARTHRKHGIEDGFIPGPTPGLPHKNWERR